MKQCIKITFCMNSLESFLSTIVRKNAMSWGLEGAAQLVEKDKAIITVCGEKEFIDKLLDLLHKGVAKTKPELIEVEPYFKEKDYRGTFRVIM